MTCRIYDLVKDLLFPTVTHIDAQKYELAIKQPPRIVYDSAGNIIQATNPKPPSQKRKMTTKNKYKPVNPGKKSNLSRAIEKAGRRRRKIAMGETAGDFIGDFSSDTANDSFRDSKKDSKKESRKELRREISKLFRREFSRLYSN